MTEQPENTEETEETPPQPEAPAAEVQPAEALLPKEWRRCERSTHTEARS